MNLTQWRTFGRVSLNISLLALVTSVARKTSVLPTIIISAYSTLTLYFPSSQKPKTNMTRAAIGSPYLARTLATLAEFCVVDMQARCSGIAFDSSPLFPLMVLTQCLCWGRLVHQGELWTYFIEITWGLLQAYIAANGKGDVANFTILFTAYMFILHIPSRYTKQKIKYIKNFFKNPRKTLSLLRTASKFKRVMYILYGKNQISKKTSTAIISTILLQQISFSCMVGFY